MFGKLKRKLFVYMIPKKKLAILIFFLAAMFVLMVLSGPFSYIAFAGKLSGITVAVDPGHGGIDGGVMVGQYLEKDVNLKIAGRLRKKLKEEGARVILTRKQDADVSDMGPKEASRHRRDLLGRINTINQSGADLFVSIHVNSCEASYVRGSICFYETGRGDSKKLSECLQTSLNRVTGRDLQEGELVHREIKEGDFSLLLRETEPPGSMIEVGFATNPTERKLLTETGYQKEITVAIKEGIENYVAEELSD